MKTVKKLLCLILCLALCAGFAACEKEPESSQVSSEEVSSEVSAVSEVSEPEAESSTFVPAEDLIPPNTDGDSEFDREFSQNPIDKKYDEDYSLAASYSMMRSVCNDAAVSWKNMIDIAYDEAYNAADAETQLTLQEEHAKWNTELDGKLEKIREEAGDSNEGVLTAAKNIVLLYRERAKDLCRVKYNIDGKMPEFPTDETVVG